MSLWETLITALTDIGRHKFRSILAALGIIFGVASVEAMLSIGEGASRETLRRIEAMGVDNITIRSVKPPEEDRKGSEAGFFLDYGLRRRDIEHVRNTFPAVQYAIGVRDMRKRLYSTDGRQLDLAILATEPDFRRITRSRLVRGRFLVHLDQIGRKRVCVVGAAAARSLFQFRDPLARTVRIDGQPYVVVGVLTNDAALNVIGGKDINTCVFVPLATSRALYGDQVIIRSAGASECIRIELDAILLQLADAADIPHTAARLRHYLGGPLAVGQRHPNKDYELEVPLALMNQKAASQRIFSVVMGSIAGISLLIGGIGIMNIQLANVSDRRKEIGTRRALGACRADILRQFIIESATLTTLGGLTGTGVGYFLSHMVSQYAGWPTVITSTAVTLGLGVSCAVGIIFGLWPAWQAANVRPIEALRSE